MRSVYPYPNPTLGMGLIAEYGYWTRPAQPPVYATADGSLAGDTNATGAYTASGLWLGSILLRLPITLYYFLLLLVSPTRVQML